MTATTQYPGYAALAERERVRQMAAANGPRIPTKERGASLPSVGVQRVHGLETDTNELWRPPARWNTVRQMRSSPSVNAAVDAIVLSLLSADVQVVPGSPDPLDVDIAAMFENDLRNMKSASLFDLRWEALDGACWNGCTPYQTLFGFNPDDGLWHLSKLALRPPSSVSRWPTDDHGGPAGIVQLDPMGEEIEFEMEELLVFVLGRQGGDLTGRPLTRRMYPPWYVLDKLYHIGPAALERHALGVSVMRGLSDTDAEEARIDDILTNLSSGVTSWVRLPSAQDMDDLKVMGVDGTLADSGPMMEFMRKEIFLSSFTQGQVLGTDGVGSLALSETHMSVLMTLLRAIARMEQDTFERYLFPRWVRYNWPDVPESRMPKLKAASPDVRDVKTFFEGLLAGTEAGVQWNREAVNRRAHEELGVELPERAKPVQDGEGADTPEAHSVHPVAKPPAEGRAAEAPIDPTGMASTIALEALEIRPDYVRMAGAYKDAETAVLEKVRRIQRRQQSNLLNRAREVVQAGDPAAVAATEVRFTDEMAAELEGVYGGLYDQGTEELRSELEQQGVKAPKVPADRLASDRAMIAAVALVSALALADRLKMAWSREALSQIRTGAYDKDRIAGVMSSLAESTVLDLARSDTTVAFGTGRAAAGEAASEIISHYINSEVLDGNTCGPCRKADGVRIEPDELEKYAPYYECEGGNRCRGVAVPVLKKGPETK